LPAVLPRELLDKLFVCKTDHTIDIPLTELGDKIANPPLIDDVHN